MILILISFKPKKAFLRWLLHLLYMPSFNSFSKAVYPVGVTDLLTLLNANNSS